MPLYIATSISGLCFSCDLFKAGGHKTSTNVILERTRLLSLVYFHKLMYSQIFFDRNLSEALDLGATFIFIGEFELHSRALSLVPLSWQLLPRVHWR